MNKEIKYIVKPEEKMVIGIYELPHSEVLCELNNFTYSEREIIRAIFLYSERFADDINNPYRTKFIKAIARCHGDDEFDETFGKKLVEAKISKKRHEIVCKQLIAILEIVGGFREKAMDLLSKHDDKQFHILRDLKDYFGVEGDLI